MCDHNRNLGLCHPTFQFIYNSYVNSSISMSFFEVVYDYKPRKPLDLHFMSPYIRVSGSAKSFARRV